MIKQLRALYEQGNNTRIVRIISRVPEEERTTEELYILAWAYFRLGKYIKCYNTASILKEKGDGRADGIMAQVRAKIGEDERELLLLHEEYPDDRSILNAVIICARNDSTNIPIEFVNNALVIVEGETGIVSNHVRNNAARVFLKVGTKEEIRRAIDLWMFVGTAYGEKNYHHRAAVFFWLSKAYEKLGVFDSAEAMAEISLDLWKKQFKEDSENLQWQKNLQNAEERLRYFKQY